MFLVSMWYMKYSVNGQSSEIHRKEENLINWQTKQHLESE